jgi:hypothetical protein
MVSPGIGEHVGECLHKQEALVTAYKCALNDVLSRAEDYLRSISRTNHDVVIFDIHGVMVDEENRCNDLVLEFYRTVRRLNFGVIVLTSAHYPACIPTDSETLLVQNKKLFRDWLGLMGYTEIEDVYCKLDTTVDTPEWKLGCRRQIAERVRIAMTLDDIEENLGFCDETGRKHVDWIGYILKIPPKKEIVLRPT